MYGQGKSWEIEKEQSKYSLKSFLFYSRKETNNFKQLKTGKITMFNADKLLKRLTNCMCTLDILFIDK